MKRMLYLLVPIAVLASCMKEAGLQESGQDIAFCFSMAQPEQVDLSSGTGATSAAAGQINDTKVYIHSFSSDIESGEDGEETKGAMVSSLYDTFTLFGYLFSGDWSSSYKPNFAHDVLVTRTGTWTPERELKWSGNQNVKFYAYSPGEPTGLNLLSTYNDGGAPLIEYTIPASVPSQIDLLDAESAVYKGDGSDATTGVSMQFRHILTGIKFKMAAFGIPCVVKSVTVEGVYNKGRHQLGTSTWTNLSGAGSYAVSMNVNVGEEGVVSLTSGENEMMLLPQTCPAGATLTVSVEYQGNTYDLSVDLSGQVWEAGKEITYTVSTSSSGWLAHILDVGTVNEMSDITGVQDVTSVVSYSINLFGGQVAMPWAVSFSTDGGATFSSTPPSWVTSFTSAGNGGKTGEAISASFADRDVETLPSEWSFRPIAGSPSQRVDLSLVSPFTRETISRESANCYIVDGPGYYKIPLFYGNSIVNGVENPVAYTKQSATNQISFIDGAGNTISTGNIASQLGGTSNVGNANLVWSTVHDLISVSPTIEYDGGVGYICFNVSQDVMSEGNACIGLLKKGSTTEYIWSWHIWFVSPERNLGAEMYINNGGDSFNLLNAALGSTGHLDRAKDGRTLTIMLSNAHATRVFDVVQPQITSEPRSIGSLIHTYYQWGSPVVFPYTVSNTSYNTGALQVTNNFISSAASAGIQDVISKPYCVYTKYEVNGNYNAWDAENTGITNHLEVKKTVYDPSPATYQVPFRNFNTGLTIANVITQTESGERFKRTPSDTVGAEWQRNYSGTSYGYYWSACAGCDFMFYNAGASSYQASQYRQYPIRPQKRP